jgi:homoserine dehydrogenase
MKEDGRTFGEVLKEAQALGYAEKNPEADVEGYDSCRKIAILSSLAFGEHVNFQDIPTEGITNITKEDIAYAEEMGYVIKLLATCQKQDAGVFARVSPMLISKTHPLATVNDVFNGILVKGNVIGEVMFYGRGAGKLPTASAVVADIVDAAKHTGTNVIVFWNKDKIELKDKQQVKTRYFVRLKKEAESLPATVKEVFENIEEIRSISGEYAFITSMDSEVHFAEKINRLRDLKVISKIRIEK